jgi:eukaryotic-like serine/threonine-protein kinase
MNLKEFLVSKVFLKNLLAAAGILILLITITLTALKIYTSHGKAYGVPNLIGMSEEGVKMALKDENLDYKIVDSTFVSENNPGSVVEQVPKPGEMIKKNRTILLTVNSWNPELVTLPKFINISFRQAMAQIEGLGLKLGKISYSPSEFNDLVLKASSDWKEVHQGDVLPKGSTIDFVVGKGTGLDKTPIPNLTGMSIGDAKLAILDASLTPGVAIYDESVVTLEDSVNARVWRQRPAAANSVTVDLGTSIDLWLTVDSLKVKPAAGTQPDF